MRNSTIANANVALDSNAGLDVITNTNMATLAAVGLGACTAGGAMLIGAAVAPTQVFGTAAVAIGFSVIGQNKSDNGGYFKFTSEMKDISESPSIKFDVETELAKDAAEIAASA